MYELRTKIEHFDTNRFIWAHKCNEVGYRLIETKLSNEQHPARPYYTRRYQPKNTTII